MANPPRDIFKIIIKNFLNSLKPRQFRGNYKGEDYFGNKYYEIPPHPSSGKRKPSRWFEPAKKEAFDQETTAEWDAWLRFRRDDPPTKEELARNLQIMELKKRNAAKLEAERQKPDGKELPKEESGFHSFPKYDEYELIPGKDPMKKN